jgi:hypothetical protein
MSRSLNIGFDPSAAFAHLDGLADAGESEAVTRPAAQAMAQVFYEQVRTNVLAMRQHTGNLLRSIYQAHSADASRPGVTTYHVSWNAKKAPHGHLVEYGHLQRYEITYDRELQQFITHKDRPLPTPKHVAARSFVRAALSRQDDAIAVGKARYIAELQKLGFFK